ncbi:hypothetical protein XF_0341 [Xylella fastidiosa 9a5c]|uniref:Uncharacterized protein n=1 Tax=Xylella fastidiosa (strain 9a5c) TaxID=160492 RepID=Q9PGG1_XYLFA|nr:hypothetical protein XF_0341 [Xylella fastidiosa 9a5c]
MLYIFYELFIFIIINFIDVVDNVFLCYRAMS